MAKAETWYDRQANISKMITYSALLVLLGSMGWAAYSGWETYAQSTSTVVNMDWKDQHPDYHMAMLAAVGGVATAAFLVGVSAIIDLLIVQCEALRSR
ncbi:MAG TPA: hypothetical protein VGN88_06275 [Phycisphaerae bacterium]